MGRHLLAEPELRPLVDRVAALAINAGSINRLQQQLTAVLPADRSEGWIYPNRLHTLLSEDPSKGINTGTVDVLRRALDRLGDSPPASTGERADVLREEARRAWAAEPDGATLARIRAVSERLGLPPAAVRLLLAEASVLDRTGEPGAPPATHLDHAPDWSFQDVACEACLTELTANDNAKIGLVLPTGAGKTRVATRIALRVLEVGGPETVCLWVTHRKHLKTQALRELQRAISLGTPDLPDDAVALLGERVEICMLSELPERLSELGRRVALVVVDEAHHAAAPSYQAIFERRPQRALFLTATPNRTDKLPIGIDGIAYTTTYRELFERGVIIEPKLDELTIDGFDWHYSERVRDLADFLLDRAESEFAKTLVVVSRIEHVESLYETVTEQLTDHPGHVLTEDDIAFVHGSASSSGEPAQAFLDEFGALPRGILIATSNLLGEGYDDPSVDAVVVTYATGSLIQLMQAAGRCMRYTPGKSRATVVQLKHSPLAYHWEQRWLYQDISDVLRPRLEDLSYSTFEELAASVEGILVRRRVAPGPATVVRAQLAAVEPGEHCALLLTGLPYDGPRECFEAEAEWSAVLVTAGNRELFLRVFNEFSARGADVNDFDDFLANYADPADGLWQPLKDMLWAMHYAVRELGGESYVGRGHRPITERGTTWLTYVTLIYEPALPAALAEFLADAVNGQEIATTYLGARELFAAAVKLPLPLGGTLAFLLDGEQSRWLEEQTAKLTQLILADESARAFSVSGEWRLELAQVPVAQLIVEQIESLLGERAREQFVLELDSALACWRVAPAAAA
jgi:superfamily II DNA or RNA helicase